MVRLRWTMAFVAVLLLAVAVLAPLTLRGSAPISVAIYAGLSWFCHQDPSRGFWLAGMPTALCARCIGALLGVALGLVLSLEHSTPNILRMLLIAAVAWFGEALTTGWPAIVRLLAGALIGLALAAPFIEASRRGRLC